MGIGKILTELAGKIEAADVVHSPYDENLKFDSTYATLDKRLASRRFWFEVTAAEMLGASCPCPEYRKTIALYIYYDDSPRHRFAASIARAEDFDKIADILLAAKIPTVLKIIGTDAEAFVGAEFIEQDDSIVSVIEFQITHDPSLEA